MTEHGLGSLHESAKVLSAPESRPAAVDLLRLRTRLLSTASLAWLADGGYFRPGESSPLAPFSGPEPWCSAAERQRAGARLLASDPFRSGARLVAQRLRLSPLGQALAVLERPEARLRIAIAEPYRPPKVLQLFLRGRLAVAGESDPEGFRLSEPLRLPALRSALADQLDASHIAPQLEALALLPEVFELLTALWKKQGRAVGEPLTEERLINLLGGLADGCDESRSLLTAMVAAELLEPRGAAYFLAPPLARWLDLVWSDHVLEIERQELTASGEPGAEQRLIFAGPAGARVLCEELAGSPAGEAPVLLFQRLPRWELEQRLARHLAGGRGGTFDLAPAPSGGGDEGEVGPRFPWPATLSVH